MRLLGSLLILLAVASPAASYAAGAPACAVALDFILSVGGHGKHTVRFVVGPAPDASETAPYSPETLGEADWSGPPPSTALLNDLMTQTPVSVFDSCPGFASQLSQVGVASGADVVAQAAAVDSGIDTLPTYSEGVLTLSTPVVEGSDALLQDRLCSGRNACAGSIVHLRKDAKTGRWKPIDQLLSLSS